MSNLGQTPHDPLRAMKRLVIRGTAGAFVVRGLAAVATLCMNIALARMLSMADYGVIALGLSWLTIAGTIACFGTDTLSLRFVAEGLAKRDLTQVAGVIRWGGRLTIKLGFVSALASAVLLALLFQGYSTIQLDALWLIISTTPLFAFALNRANVLRGEKKVILGATVEMFIRPFSVLLFSVVLFMTIRQSFGVIEAAAVVAVAQVLPALVGLIQCSGHAKSDVQFAAIEHTRVWIRTAAPMAAMSIMGVVMSNLDTIVIGYFMSPDSAGVYRASAQLANLVAFGLAASNGIVAPLIAELFSSGKMDELRRILRYSVTFVSIGGVVGVLILSIFGPQLLSMFGAKYQTGYQVLLILLTGQAINALCGPTGFMMSMTGYQNQALRIFVVSTVINIILNFLLVPRMGLIGGAIANVTGLLLWNFAILVYLRRNLRLDPSVLFWVSFPGRHQDKSIP